MGNFYTNFLIAGKNSDQVVVQLQILHRHAYVSPSTRGLVTVFDKECDTQDVEEIEELGRALAVSLKASVLAVLNHDDDHLLFWLFKDDRCVGHYASFIHGLSFAWRLSRVRGGVQNFPLIAAVLSFPTFIFQITRHHLLAWLLDLPPCCVGSGYRYIDRGEIPEGLEKEDLKQTRG